ncbi:hypothetical protein HPP92_023110 [Vanilla planifolia]|uniref:Uncharacterized protein n=1 Tax=Vanilla planifolia TaxID=51239 RepID=A0A835UFR5_VANPL|nr:hypothetical protein HPP92_023110 [Vanilla planifolia]
MTGSMVFKEINIDGDLSVGPPHDVRLRSDSPLTYWQIPYVPWKTSGQGCIRLMWLASATGRTIAFH